MYSIINDLMNFFGIATIPATFGEFLSWFVMFLFGMEFVLYILDSIFYTIRQLSKGVR